MVAGPRVARIEKYAAAHQDALQLGDRRGRPAHVVVAAAWAAGAAQAVVEPDAHRVVPVAIVRDVDRDFAGDRIDPRGRLDEPEAVVRRVEGVELGAGADRQRERRRRAVDDDAGGQLVAARLQHDEGAVGGSGRRQHRKDRADRRVGLDVGRAVDRVGGDDQRRARVEQHRLGDLFRNEYGDRCPPEFLGDAVAGDDVELFLLVGRAAPARAAGQIARQVAARRERRDAHGRPGHGAHSVGDGARGGIRAGPACQLVVEAASRRHACLGVETQAKLPCGSKSVGAR